jgi:hypothetical protein
LYPYSPSLAGAENQRALLADATAAVASAVPPKQGSNDSEFRAFHAIKDMKREGWLTTDSIENLKPAAATRFRRGRGLAVDWAKTPWSNGAAGGKASNNEPPLDDGGQLVNSSSID